MASSLETFNHQNDPFVCVQHELSLVCSVTGWQVGAKPQWDIIHLRRAVSGSSVPLPRAVLKLVSTCGHQMQIMPCPFQQHAWQGIHGIQL